MCASLVDLLGKCCKFIEWILAKIGLDTADNEPLKVWGSSTFLDVWNLNYPLIMNQLSTSARPPWILCPLDLEQQENRHEAISQRLVANGMEPPICQIYCNILQNSFCIFFANFAIFWRARSRMYQNEILQETMHLTAFFKFYKICILLHRCNLKILEKTVWKISISCENSATILQMLQNYWEVS